MKMHHLRSRCHQAQNQCGDQSLQIIHLGRLDPQTDQRLRKNEIHSAYSDLLVIPLWSPGVPPVQSLDCTSLNLQFPLAFGPATDPMNLCLPTAY